jgi:hypothetical protein
MTSAERLPRSVYFTVSRCDDRPVAAVAREVGQALNVVMSPLEEGEREQWKGECLGLYIVVSAVRSRQADAPRRIRVHATQLPSDPTIYAEDSHLAGDILVRWMNQRGGGWYLPSDAEMAIDLGFSEGRIEDAIATWDRVKASSSQQEKALLQRLADLPRPMKFDVAITTLMDVDMLLSELGGILGLAFRSEERCRHVAQALGMRILLERTAPAGEDRWRWRLSGESLSLDDRGWSQEVCWIGDYVYNLLDLRGRRADVRQEFAKLDP